MAVKLQLIKIDGTDVTSRRFKSIIEDTIEDQSDKVMIEFNNKIISTLPSIAAFNTIEIWEAYSGTLEQDINRVFKGVVSLIDRKPNMITVTGYGELWRAVQTRVNKTYDRNIDVQAGKGSEIFKNLCDLSGLSYTSSTVIDTGPTILLDKFVCAKAEAYERMNTLATIYGYQIWYNSRTDLVHFEPIGLTTNSGTLVVGTTNANITGLPKWKEDGTQLFNKVEVIGAFQEVQKTETFSGDNVQTSFTLSEEPQITEVTVDSIQQIGGTTGATATFDYSVDKDQKQINFESGSIPSVGVNNVSIFYSYRAPRPVVISSPSSILSTGRTINRTFTFNDIQQVDDAETRARELIAVFSVPFISTNLKVTPNATETINPQVGQIIRVIDSRYSYDRLMLIKSMKINYPSSDVQITVGDKDVRVGDLERDTTIRIKRLEEELAKSGTFIVEVIDLNNKVNVKNRYVKIQKRSIVGNTLIWGHSTFGIWNSFDWGDSIPNSFILNSIFQGRNIYTETFYDEDFNDTTKTTGNWTTGGLIL